MGFCRMGFWFRDQLFDISFIPAFDKHDCKLSVAIKDILYKFLKERRTDICIGKWLNATENFSHKWKHWFLFDVKMREAHWYDVLVSLFVKKNSLFDIIFHEKFCTCLEFLIKDMKIKKTEKVQLYDLSSKLLKCSLRFYLFFDVNNQISASIFLKS